MWGDQVLKFTELEGQGIDGADLPCAHSLVPGKCVLSILDEAMLVCHALGELCKAVTVYFKGTLWVTDASAMSVPQQRVGTLAASTAGLHWLSAACTQLRTATSCMAHAAGLDGCSDTPVAALKTASPYPDNSWVSPHVSTLVRAAAAASAGCWQRPPDDMAC